MRNKFLKIAGVAVLGVILLCVLLGVFQRPVNRGIWLMENVEALTSGETGGVYVRCITSKGYCHMGNSITKGILFVE